MVRRKEEREGVWMDEKADRWKEEKGGWVDGWKDGSQMDGENEILSSSDILVSHGEPVSPTSLSGASQEPASSFQIY